MHASARSGGIVGVVGAGLLMAVAALWRDPTTYALAGCLLVFAAYCELRVRKDRRRHG